MTQLNATRLVCLLLALALTWSLCRAESPASWLDAQAQDRARELAEIDAETHRRPGEDYDAFTSRRYRAQEARKQLCRR